MRIPGGIGPLALVCLLFTAVLLWMGVLPAPIFDLVFILSLAVSLLGSLPRFGVSAEHARLGAAAFAIASIGLLLGIPGLAVTPFLAVALAYAQLSYVFAHGLMPGRQPILEQLIRLMAIKTDGTPEFWHFVRGQCRLWTVLCGLMTALSLLAMLSQGSRDTAGTALTLGVIGQLAVFVLSHIYAGWRYGRPETWVQTLKAMFRPAIWSKLEL